MGGAAVGAAFGVSVAVVPAGEVGLAAGAGGRGPYDWASATIPNSRSRVPSATRKAHILDALPMPADKATFRARRDRAAARARELDLCALLVSPGSDLGYLTGHHIRESERLTCLVLAADGAGTLVVPELEAARAAAAAPGLTLLTWGETTDPARVVAKLVPRFGTVAVAERMWATFLMRLEAALPGRHFVGAGAVTAPLRAVKDEREVDARLPEARPDPLVLDLADVFFIDVDGVALFRELAARRVTLTNGSLFVTEQLKGMVNANG